jgi:hypothetical protein
MQSDSPGRMSRRDPGYPGHYGGMYIGDTGYIRFFRNWHSAEGISEENI